MKTLYNQEVREFIHTRQWPSGLTFEVRENPEPEPHLNIVFFRDNWLTLTRDAQYQTTEVVREIMFKLWNDGVPTYVEKMESAKS